MQPIGTSLDPEVYRLMHATIATAIATRRTSIAEAAAEARGLALGRQPALPASVVGDAVAIILDELGAGSRLREAVEHDGKGLLPAEPEEVADALAYAMRFDERGKARRTGAEYAAKLAAEHLVRHLLLSGYVVLRKPAGPQHSA